jgi:ABC-type oligopeptide transport system substrate-binding subunit
MEMLVSLDRKRMNMMRKLIVIALVTLSGSAFIASAVNADKKGKSKTYQCGFAETSVCKK